MNGRDRWHAVTHYQPCDRLFRWEMGPWSKTLRRWEREGLPENDYFERIIGLDRLESVPVSVLEPCPTFVEENLEVRDGYRIYRTPAGVIRKRLLNDGDSTMPQFLDHPIKNRGDWVEYKKRLDPDTPRRFPLWWDSLKASYADRDFALGIRAGSMFGSLCRWIGMERFCVMFYDEPHFVHEMMDYLADFYVKVLEKVVFAVKLDYAILWEDMAYKTASMISPQQVREFMVPGYKKITDLLHSAGIDIIALDSDGNVEQLIPIWLECGINFMLPMEVAAGMDVVRLRKKFGKELRMAGGMDKRVLATGDRRKIRQMVDGVRDLILEGGYVPAVDHFIPSDVSWESFRYYRGLLDEIGS